MTKSRTQRESNLCWTADSELGQDKPRQTPPLDGGANTCCHAGGSRDGAGVLVLPWSGKEGASTCLNRPGDQHNVGNDKDCEAGGRGRRARL